MENLINNLCVIYVIIAIIGLIVSLLFNNILTFVFCAIAIILFVGIILIEVVQNNQKK